MAAEPQASAGADARARLSFERTVPCSHAHRRALGEVFVADSVAVGADAYLLAIQLPRAHSVWFDRTVPYHDTLSTAEAARQGAFVVVHRHLGVPVGLPFSLRSFEVRIHDLEAYRDDERTPLEGILRFRLSQRDLRGDEIGSLAFEGEVEVGDRLAMTLGGGIMFLPKADYEALREYQRTRKPVASAPPERVAPLAPELVGRVDSRNVVIGEGRPAAAAGEARYPLVIDRTHPSFFDHDYDHVPGPLMVEAFRQASLVTATRSGALPSPVAAVTHCEMAFSDFGEFDAVVEISVAPVAEADGIALSVGAHQFGKQIGAGRIDLRPWPEPA
jgi:hypothetical protein